MTRLSIDGLQVEMTTVECEIPDDERTRLQPALTELSEHVQAFPDPSLGIRVFYHPRSGLYNAEFKLRLPGQSLFRREKDTYLDTALSRGLAKLTHRVEAYKKHPDREALAAAERRAALEANLVAPDLEEGPIAQTVEAGDYRSFRKALSIFEEWLNKRVGRLVQRHDEFEAEVGHEFLLSDVVEEVYLNAFDRFDERPKNVPLSEWLEGLIEPSIRLLLRNYDEEQQAVSFARTLSETETSGQ